MKACILIAPLLFTALLPQWIAAASPPDSPVGAEPSTQGATRLIVRTAPEIYSAQKGVKSVATRIRELGFGKHRIRAISDNLIVVELSPTGSQSDRLQFARKIRSTSGVADVEVDRPKFGHAAPSDPLFGDQWYLLANDPASIGAVEAWDKTVGNGGTVVAVLDTGVLYDHPDLQRATSAGRLLPGYDFVSAESDGGALRANDGNGWDDDPSDPGDWVDGIDQAKPIFSECTIRNSSWHGTRVSGMIAANTNNAIGVAGVTWSSYILPVRVLGKCNGFDSDILPAMRWAAGLHVSGVPDNPYPAKILNLSLGSADICSAAYRSVLDELANIGVLVVASAGNESGPIETPANCPGVVAVTGLRHAGTKVGYSSYGPEATIGAPAGNCVNLSGACLFSLHTTVNTGTKTPAINTYSDQYRTNLGTSFAAPLVSGVASLMNSLNAKLSAQALRQRLIEGSRPFPTYTGLFECPTPASANNPECICTQTTCGYGMLYAPGAVAAASRPFAAFVATPTTTPGKVTLSGSPSTASCGHNLRSYAWSVASVNGTAAPIITNPNQADIELAFPASGTLTMRMTVADEQGLSDSLDVEVTAAGVTTPPTVVYSGSVCATPINISPNPTLPLPQPQPGPTDEGGGSSSLLFLAALLAVLALRKRNTSNANSTVRNSR